jgi:hypothetical protein
MPHVTDELELPPLDGEMDEGPPPGLEADVSVRDEEDPYDDSEGVAAPGDDPPDEDEPSALADDAVGFAAPIEEPIEDDHESLLGDDDSPGTAGEDFDVNEGDDAVRDGGEEGFDEPEPELRAEDLPRLDEGTDDDLSIEEAVDAVIAQPDLRWDDRGFERVITQPIGHVVRLRIHGGLVVTLEDGSVKRSVDGGETFSAADHGEEEDEALVVRGRARALLREGVGVLRALDDGPLTLVESTAEATAFTLLDDGSVLVAMDGPERMRLVRVGVDGSATVVAEEEGSIEALATDVLSGLVWAGGTFGLIGYRPR